MSLVTRKAPDFSIDAVVGDGDFKKVSLGDYKGKYVVLFFYPADFTFICPTEIQEFSRRYEEFRAVNCEVLGVSTDSKHSHKAWIKNGLGKLNHPLLADFNKTISSDYEALIEGGVACRATIIIDPERHRSARVVQRRPARALGQRDAAPGAGAADRRALPGRVEAGTEDARQAGVERASHASTARRQAARPRFFPRRAGASILARREQVRRCRRSRAGRRAGRVRRAARRRRPRLWTLFDVQALYAAARAGLTRIATDAALPGGIPLGQHARRRQATLFGARRRWAEGYRGRVRDHRGLDRLRRALGAAAVRAGEGLDRRRAASRRSTRRGSRSSASARAAASTARSGRSSTSTSPTTRRRRR